MAVARHLALDAIKRHSQERRVMAVEEIDSLLADAPATEVDVEEMVWAATPRGCDTEGSA